MVLRELRELVLIRFLTFLHDVRVKNIKCTRFAVIASNSNSNNYNNELLRNNNKKSKERMPP